MKRILDDIKVKAVGDTTWELLESFIYHVGNPTSPEAIVVLEGFRTDFATIPKMFHGIINPTGRIKPAALVHDYMYSLQGRMPSGRKYTRKRCDQIFLEIMKVVELAWFKRSSAYNLVRMFGWAYWNKSKVKKED